MEPKKLAKKQIAENAKIFRLELFNAVEIYFKENFPNVPLVVKQRNLDQRIRLKNINDPWKVDFSTHSLCFRVLIRKSNSPCINKTLYLFLKSIYDIMATQLLEEDVKNIDTVKSYFPFIQIMMI